MPERRHLIASAIVVLLLALLPLAGSRYAVDLATEVLIYVLFALSLNVLIGFTGNISFGHAAYFAIGGYACAILLTTYGWPLASPCRRRWCWPGWWPRWSATSACG